MLQIFCIYPEWLESFESLAAAPVVGLAEWLLVETIEMEPGESYKLLLASADLHSWLLCGLF